MIPAGSSWKIQAFADEIGMQVDIAIEEADVILFLVNAIEGVTDDDIAIARKLQKSKKPVVLAVNKADNENLRMSIYDLLYARSFRSDSHVR